MDEAKKGLIGPHEGREFELLDACKKHVAYFYDIIPCKYETYKQRPEYETIEWDDALEAPIHPRLEIYARTPSGEIIMPYRVLYRKTHRKQAERLVEIQTNYNRNVDLETKVEIEREIGQILGYSEESIEQYIDRFVERMKKNGRVRE